MSLALSKMFLFIILSHPFEGGSKATAKLAIASLLYLFYHVLSGFTSLENARRKTKTTAVNGETGVPRAGNEYRIYVDRNQRAANHWKLQSCLCMVIVITAATEITSLNHVN